MAFNFLGTFTREEVEVLLDFAEDQLQDVGDRIQFLRSQIENLGWIEYEFDAEDNPISYSVTPEKSVLAKYIRTYQFFGGDLLELSVRSRGQWLALAKVEPSLDDQEDYEAGAVEGRNAPQYENLHYDDAVPAITVAKVKDFIRSPIQGKREEWEFRIKKAVDLADQYLEEIILLVRRSSGSETLSDLQTKIEYYLNDREFHSAGLKPRL